MGTGMQPSFWPGLGELRIPCLIMAGELDAKFRTIAHSMAEVISASRLALVPEAGHTIHLEQPAAFARLVLEFAAGGHQA